MFSMSAISEQRSLLTRRDVSDHDGTRKQAGDLRGTPAALAGDM